jgi:serine/threonine protein kinase
VTDATDGADAAAELVVPGADGQPLAVRRPGPGVLDDPAFQDDFPGEVAAMRGVTEPRLSVPTNFLRNESGRIVASLRPHVPGMRLSRILERRPRGLDVQTTTIIAVDVLSALGALHGRWVAHRDVSAENVVVDSDGVCVLVDAGLAPRARRGSLDAAVAVDLAWFAELIVHCLAGGPAGRRRRQAPILLGAWLPRTLPEPLRSLLRSALRPTNGVESANAALAELSNAVGRRFDADWDIRARERLAGIAHVAANSTSTSTAYTAAQRAITYSTYRRARDNGRGVRMARGPIAVALLSAGAAVVAFTVLNARHPTAAQITTYATGTPGAPHVQAGGPPAGGGQRTPVATPPAPVRTGTAARMTPTTVPTVTTTPPTNPVTTAATTTVATVTIVELAYQNGFQTQAVVVVRVNTSGPGAVVLTLQIASSNQWNTAGGNPALSVSYTLQGKQSYTISYQIDSAQYCAAPYWGVTALIQSQPSATRYAQLVSPSC